MDLAAWLESQGFGEYTPAFEENRIGPDLLPGLSDQDLREIGIRALGDRKRLLAAIAALVPVGEEAAPVETPEGERRQVTVLFADIAGFTALSERLGAEATHAVLNRYFGAADRIIEEFGGRIDKHIGDNVMAVFGAPVAHDNDPERAARAALAIHAAAARIETSEGPLALHIGIASGQVVASGTGSDSHREYTVTGDTVNLAARLEALADPGQTLVSDAVRQRIVGHFEMTGLGPQEIRGLARPVAVWRVDAVAASSAGPRTPFVGRRSEIRQCRAIIEETASTGKGAAILLRGAAGIGKTRLAEEAMQSARDTGFAVHRCLVLDFGSRRGQDAIPALVRSLLGLPSLAPENRRAEAALAALETGACTEDQRVFLNDMLDLPQPLETKRLYDAMDDAGRMAGRCALVAGLAAWAARGQPQLIQVEDLHWADPRTLGVLGAVVGTARDHPLVVLATTRPEGDPLEGAWRALSLDQPVSIINLGPLRDSEAKEMAAGYARATRESLEQCLARAGGNPLFLEQLLQNAAESATSVIPGSIQSLVLARMDRLEPADKRALQAASIFGQRFSIEALRHVLDAPGYDCAGLIRHQMVRPEGEDLLFAHALIRDGVYESVLTATRTRLHLKAAEWFADSDAALHASHLELAGDAGAARAYLNAARAELVAYRHGRGIRLLEKGRALAADDRDRIEIALALGGARHDIGELDRAREAFAAALDAAGDGLARCRALLGLAAIKRITENLDGALSDLDTVLAEARRLGLAAEEARAHHLRGNVLFPRGDIDGCLREHGCALEIARAAGLAEIEAAALGGLADGEYLRGRFRSACDRFTECVELSRRHGFGRIEVANLPMVAITAMWAGETARALDLALESIEAARRVGHDRAEMVAHHVAFLCLKMRADLDAARQHIEPAIRLAQGLGARRFEAEAMLFGAELDHLTGNRASALATAREAVAITREVGMAYMGPTILGGLALVTDDDAERKAAIAEAEQLLAAGSVSHNHVFLRVFAIESSLATGEYGEAQRHADALATYNPEAGLGLFDFHVARGHALARAGMGERAPELCAEIDRLIAEGETLWLQQSVEALLRARKEMAA